MAESMSKLYWNDLVQNLVKGHAAVLVGAGFSRNAEPVDPASNAKLPDWNGLTDAFCERLGIKDDERKRMNVLFVAQRMKDTYGRPELNQMLREQMPDDAFKPSEIHVNLLKLPWTDVFTTNYDTLLERACDQVTSRRYRIVAQQEDLLCSAGGARIIKLHGSFPSPQSFIITKEDYQTYPQKHALLVNTVQQSMIENTFYLVGFSGNDPNFLHWIGWLHENLGMENSPKIYLITHQHMSELKEKLPQDKNVEILSISDLGICDEDAVDSGNAEIRVLYKKFFEELVKEVEKQKAVEKQKDVEREWPQRECIVSSWRYRAGEEASFLERLRKLHSTYPGWVMLPHDRRSLLGDTLSMEALFFGESETERAFELEICREYCWLHEILGRPLSYHEIDCIKKIMSRHEDQNGESQYHEILLTMLYSCRAINLDVEWNRIHDELAGLRLDGDSENHLIFEEIWHDIYSLRWDKINDKLNTMKICVGQEEWGLRKASLLAMVGRYDECNSLLKECLGRVRRDMCRLPDDPNERQLSLESCLVNLYNYAEQAHRYLSGNIRNLQDFEREKAQEKSDFEFESENSYLQCELGDSYTFCGNETSSPGFTIGSQLHSYRVSADAEALRAYQFLRFREMTGSPFRIGNVILKSGALGAAKRIAPYDARYPVLLALLSEENDIIKNVCDRNYMHYINQQKADEWFDACVILLRNAMQAQDSEPVNVFATSLFKYPLQVVPDILVRLCTKCSGNKFEVLWKLLLEIYNAGKRNTYVDLGGLMRQSVSCAPLDEIVSCLGMFFGFPLTKENLHIRTNHPDPFPSLCRRLGIVMREERGMKKCRWTLSTEGNHKVDEWLKQAKSKQEDVRKSAIRRVGNIRRIFSLSAEQDKVFAHSLLDEVNLDKDELSFLDYFDPVMLSDWIDDKEQLADIIQRVWNRTIAQIKEMGKDDGGISYNERYMSYAYDLVGINKIYAFPYFSITELADVFLTLCQKVGRFRESEQSDTDIATKIANKNLKMVDWILGKAILKSGQKNDADCIADAEKILTILKNCRIPHGLLEFSLGNSDERDDILLNELFSGDRDTVKEACDAVKLLSEDALLSDGTIPARLTMALQTANSYEVHNYMDALNCIVRGGNLPKEQWGILSAALEKFERMTRPKDGETSQETAGKLQTRQSAAALAHTLSIQYRKAGQDLPEGLRHWRDVCSSLDEFAEIRNQWDEIQCEGS